MKGENNHEVIPYPNEDDRAVEVAFMCLGNILAEVAEDVIRRKDRSNQDLVKDDISTNRNETGED